MRCGGSIRSASGACPRSQRSLGCLAALTFYSMAYPDEAWRGYYDDGYLSKFARSGVISISDLFQYGVLEADASVTGRLNLAADRFLPSGGPPAEHRHDP